MTTASRLQFVRRWTRGGCWWALALAFLAPVQAKDQWTKISTSHFTILTDDSVGDAKDWAVSVEAFREHLQTIAPTDDRMLDPLTLVVFKSPRVYKAVTGPLEKEPPTMVSSSRFVSRDGRFIGGVNPEEEDMARHAILLQASLWLTGSYRWPLPIWLVTGLQQIYADYSVSGNRMLIGGAVEGSAQSLGNGLRLPLDEMFGMTTSSPTYQTTDGYFNAQAWAFVHFLLLGDQGANRATLVRYMASIQRGDDPEESLRLLYPQGLADLSGRFARYVKMGNYRMETLPMDLGRIAARVNVAPAPEAEVQAALGYLCLHFQGEGVATPYFDRMAELEPRSPATFEALAELAHYRSDQAEQIRCYQQAVDAGSKFYLAHYYAFLPAVQGMFGCEAAADATDAVAARKAVDGIKELLRLRPGFYSGYETMAGLMGSLVAANDDDAALLREGRRFFPNDAVMESGQAAYEILSRHFVAAKERLGRVLAGDLSHAGRIRPYAEKLRARLNAANGCYWLEKFYAAGDFGNLEKLLPQFNGAPLRAAERERLTFVRSALGAWETIGMVKEAMDRKDWGSADVLLSGLAVDKLPEVSRAEVSALAARIAVAKQAAAK